MHLIKLDATTSTNAYLKNEMLSKVLDDFTIVVAKEQTQGRGQMGAKWDSEVGKNLTFSILKKFERLPVSQQYLINIATSLAIHHALKKMQVPDLWVKWPNDILSGHSKICGILIENMVSEGNIKASIIGIGLNVNQTSFRGLGNASSLKLLLGRTLDLNELILSLVEALKFQLERIVLQEDEKKLREDYEKVLFRKDKPSTFMDKEERMFMGFIRGISETGKLKVEMEDALFREFDLKEIKLLF